MEVTISIEELFKITLYIGGIASVTYLFKVLYNLNAILKTTREITDKNKEQISETLKRLPSIASNVENITNDVQSGVEQIKTAAGNIEKSVSEAAATVTQKAEATAEYLKFAGGIIELIIGLFSRRKK